MALHVLDNLASRVPGMFDRIGARPAIRAMAERDPDVAVRCEGLYALCMPSTTSSRRCCGPTSPAVWGPLAWVSMVALLEHDRVGHLTDAATLVAQRASYDWHHWLNELRFAVEGDEVGGWLRESAR